MSRGLVLDWSWSTTTKSLTVATTRGDMQRKRFAKAIVDKALLPCFSSSQVCCTLLDPCLHFAPSSCAWTQLHERANISKCRWMIGVLNLPQKSQRRWVSLTHHFRHWYCRVHVHYCLRDLRCGHFLVDSMRSKSVSVSVFFLATWRRRQPGTACAPPHMVGQSVFKKTFFSDCFLSLVVIHKL